MSSLTGGFTFLKLYRTSKYQQMPLDEGSQEYVTITTYQELNCYSRLPFGIASAQPFSKMQWTVSCKDCSMSYISIMYR